MNDLQRKIFKFLGMMLKIDTEEARQGSKLDAQGSEADEETIRLRFVHVRPANPVWQQDPRHAGVCSV
jgi:hypothetical protein